MRRLATVYEKVYGPLPRDQRQGRVYSEEAVERLERAREMVRAGRSTSIEAALRGEEVIDRADPQEEQHRATRDQIQALHAEVQALRATVEELVGENRALRERLPELEASEQPQEHAQEPPEVSEGVESGGDAGAPESVTQEPEYTTTGATHRLARWFRSWWR